MTQMYQSFSKYRLSRRGRKLQNSDDPRTIFTLPKIIPEKTWVEIMAKEETDLIVFDLREEILESALGICYYNYMENQNAVFTAHCAAQAWHKIIDWHYFRHDPGEDPSAYPPCYIPKRRESWTADVIPEPSPKDNWALQDLTVMELTSDERLQKWSSTTSLEYPEVEDIPEEYWFPGKVYLPAYMRSELTTDESYMERDTSSTGSHSEKIGAESEVLQKVTDYSATEEISKTSSSSRVKTSTYGSLHGAGDSTIRLKNRRDKSKVFVRGSRSLKTLPPLLMASDSKTHLSLISDCRLRNLRLDTQFEISSEKVDSSVGEVVKRK